MTWCPYGHLTDLALRVADAEDAERVVTLGFRGSKSYVLELVGLRIVARGMPGHE